MITENETINGVASVWIADELETVEYVATVENDIVTFDEITLGGEDFVSWEVEDQLRREVAQILDRYVGV